MQLPKQHHLEQSISHTAASPVPPPLPPPPPSPSCVSPAAGSTRPLWSVWQVVLSTCAAFPALSYPLLPSKGWQPPSDKRSAALSIPCCTAVLCQRGDVMGRYWDTSYLTWCCELQSRVIACLLFLVSARRIMVNSPAPRSLEWSSASKQVPGSLWFSAALCPSILGTWDEQPTRPSGHHNTPNFL